MNSIWKRRIAILVSIVLVFAIACLSGLTKGIALTAYAAGPTYAEVGTASLSDAGNTLFIRMAKFNVGTEDEPEIRYCSGFTVGDLGPKDDPTQNVNMDVLTPIWPDAPLSGTLDKDIYICGGADGEMADLYVNGLTQTEGHTLTAVGSFDVKMGALSVGEVIAPTVGVNIGDNASVTVNGDASVNYLWMYKPSLNDLEEGEADPAIYNPQYLGGTLHVTGNLSGGSGGYIYIDGGSAATVDGNVSGLGNSEWQCIQVSNEGSLTVGGGISVPGGIAISNSTLSVTEGVSAKHAVINGGSAMNVGGDLSVPNGGQIWVMESGFTVGGSVNGSDVYLRNLTETATVGGDVSASNLWVSGTGDASTSKTALTVTGDVTVSAWLDINRCATVTADDVICNYLFMEEAGPNVLNAATFKCTSDSCLYRNSTLNVAGDCTLDTPLFNVQRDSHVNVGGDLTVKRFIDVQDKSSLTVEGDISFTEAYSFQLQAFGSGVITCKGNVAAKGAVSALEGGKIAVTGTLSSTDGLSVNAMGSGSEITADAIDAKGAVSALKGGKIAVTGTLSSTDSLSVNAIWSGSEITADAIDAITVNALRGGKIAVADKLSAKTYALSVNALWGGSEITADTIDAEGCVNAIGNARVSVTGTLTTGDLGALGVLAIGKDAVVEAENINAPYINALGYYSGEGGSGTSAVIVRKDANLSQWPIIDNGGTISVGGDLNCQSFSISNQSYWKSEYTGWIHVGGDMSYAMNSGDISRGELTVGGDFINTAPNSGYGDGLVVNGGKLNVGGNVEFGSLLLNTRGDNTLLNVTGRINAARITDIIAKDENGEPLKLHTVAPFESATANDNGVISYQQPWYTQYVMLEDANGNTYRADIGDLTRTSYSAVPGTTFYADYVPTGSEDKNALAAKRVIFNGKQWYVIKDDSTSATEGTVTLLYAGSLGNAKFDEGGSNNYASSSIKTKLGNMTATGAYKGVADAIKDTENGKLYLLSADEANAVPQNVRTDFDSAGWWLRTPRADNKVAYVYVDTTNNPGRIHNRGVGPAASGVGVRPALQLDLSRVAFDSASKTFSLTTFYASYVPTGDEDADALTAKQVTFNGKQWYLIKDESTSATEGTVTLLWADSSLGNSKFDENGRDYSESSLKAKLDQMTKTGTFRNVSKAMEETQYGKLYLLSVGEANEVPVKVRTAAVFTGQNAWWLRSTDGNGKAAYVFVGAEDEPGIIPQRGVRETISLGVRPALKLKLSEVTFNKENNEFTANHIHDTTPENGTPRWSWHQTGNTWEASVKYECSCGEVTSETAVEAQVTSSEENGEITFTANDGKGHTDSKTFKKTVDITQADGSEDINGLATGVAYGTQVKLTTAQSCDWKVNGVTVSQNTNYIWVTAKEDMEVEAKPTEHAQAVGSLSLTATSGAVGSNKVKLIINYALPKGATVHSAILHRGYVNDSNELVSDTQTSFKSKLTKTNGTYTANISLSKNQQYGGWAVVEFTYNGTTYTLDTKGTQGIQAASKG